MNQILKNNSTDNNKEQNHDYKIKLSTKKLWKTQLIISIIAITFFIGVFTFYKYNEYKKEKLATNLKNSYEIYQLYAPLEKNNEAVKTENGVIGRIEIIKINVYYTIFASLSEELLKVAPCKFYGKMPNEEKGNLCIAGHNYDNDKLFSKIFLLNINDEINILDSNGDKYVYKVFEKYEVKSDDLSPLYDYDNNEYQLTLVTCNNITKNRKIVKAKILEKQ